MADAAFKAADAHFLWAGGNLESALRMERTMHRRHPAFGSMELTVGTSPARRPHALQTAFDHATKEPPSAGRVPHVPSTAMPPGGRPR